MPTRMDAAVTVDAPNAPTATWKTAQTAVSHRAHTHHRLGERKTEKNKSRHTKNLTPPAQPEIMPGFIFITGDLTAVCSRWRSSRGVAILAKPFTASDLDALLVQIAPVRAR
jgi:hypothetical protein